MNIPGVGALFSSPGTSYNVGNNVKGRISKRVFQENKARQIFRKTNISYPLIRTRTYKRPFWDSPFCLVSDDKKVYLYFSYVHFIYTQLSISWNSFLGLPIGFETAESKNN